ncbi:MAG: hypothetical protein JST90_04610 [Bacteroidetes bacterium]|nr:hypothetical protein [Bacteroidota bacterium]
MAGNTPSRSFLYTGIACTVAMACCDVILLGVPQSGRAGDIYSFSALAQVSMTRIQIGASFGLLSSLNICLGYWYLWQMLRPYSTRLVGWMLAAFTFYGVLGGVFHAGYYFAGAAMHHGDLALYFRFIHRLQLLAVVAGAGALIGSLLYAYIILRLQQYYSKWYAAFNLIVCEGIALTVAYILPAPVGGYIRPMFINLGTLLFFITLGLMSKSKTPAEGTGSY